MKSGLIFSYITSWQASFSLLEFVEGSFTLEHVTKPVDPPDLFPETPQAPVIATASRFTSHSWMSLENLIERAHRLPALCLDPRAEIHEHYF